MSSSSTTWRYCGRPSHDFVMGYKYAAIFDGWTSTLNRVVEDDD